MLTGGTSTAEQNEIYRRIEGASGSRDLKVSENRPSLTMLTLADGVSDCM